MSTATGIGIEDLPADEYANEYGEDHSLDEDVQLNSEDFISGSFLSEQCTVPQNIFKFDYSYGYDCKRYFNLVAPDENTLVFASGNLINFLNVRTKELKFRRSYLGGGIGHITTNPNAEYSHLTVAENGDNPPIIIYEWPSMEIFGILKEGAAKRYAHINYSPDGELLASQSYEPDFLITVWKWKNWRQSPIILRTKAHVHDVYRVMFSPYVPGHITTGGSGHIKFWKMSETFTGLKLQGELGRFGKTEISDIVGIYPMPDEKVISGSEWGNLLVWEAGLIKVEVFRTKRRPCHSAPVMQLEYNRSKGEIWSVSQDGWLRAWEYRIIDEADPPDEDRVVQMVPSYERETKGVHLMSICKKKLHDPDDTFYYAQDGNGGIWLVDLILRSDYEPSERLFRCHAGAVVDMAACPWGPYLISLGEDGRLQVYNYLNKTLLHFHQFPAKGRALIWVPLSIDQSGNFLIMGFDDGVVRVCVISLADEKEISVITVQSTKPHNKPITVISINEEGSLFVSAGEDNTVFLYQMENINGILLTPIGFVNVESTVTCFTWHTKISNVLLVGCQHGDLIQFNFPKQTVDYTKTSYLLHTVESIKNKFKSCKAQIRRDLHLKEIEKRKQVKIQRKMQEIADIKKDNPGLEIDEEAYLLDSESEEVLAPLEIPKIPNKIWFAMYTPEDTLWLSVGGYDAGYIYEYTIDNPEIVKATVIADGDDIEMHGFIYSYDKKYLITSMQNGAIRVNRVNPDNFHDLSDYWLLTMHDNFNGQITRMCFNYNNKYFFSCGTDGNIFSYQFNPEQEMPSVKVPSLITKYTVKEVETDEGYQSLSLEEMMIKAENDKMLRLADEHKKKLRQRLTELTDKLTSILERNCTVPKAQRYRLRHFIIDDRIMKAFDNTLEAKVELEKRKLAYDVAKSTVALDKMKRTYTDILDLFPIEVKAVNRNVSVRTIPQRSLGQKFYDIYKEVEEKLLEESLKGRLPERGVIVAGERPEPRKKQQELEPFLIGLSPSTIATKMGAKLNRSLRKYRERSAKIEKRQEEWNELNAKKPIEGANHPDDVKTLENAKHTIGDFKLQSSDDFTVPEHLQESTLKKYQQLLESRITSFDLLLHAFNAKVYRLRNKKVKMIEKMNELKMKLDKIHEELPTSRILKPPPIPEILPEDFPEKKLEVNLTLDRDALKHPRRQPKTEAKVEEDSSEENLIYHRHESDEEKIALGIKGKLPDIGGSCENIINYVLENTKRIDLSNIQEYIAEEEEATNTESPWEMEMKARRLINKIYEQDMLIAQMKQMVEDFDQEVQKINDERFRVRRDATYMDLHLLVLNQELIIIKEFESVETDLRNIALSKLTEMLDMRDDMKRIELKIEEQYRYMEQGNLIMKEIQQTFINSAKDNKFWDFLRRIFRKKYKPPKVFNPDDSQSSSMSSESSSESDDDAASLDSREIGPIRLDESVCPKGCDRDLYDNTFNLRTQRHNVEKQMKEEAKVTENLKRELEMATKKMKTIEQACQKSKNDLQEYQRLKHKKLNEVMCTVVVHLNQIQHFGEDSKSTPGMSEVLVFNEPSLKRLYERVGELQTESLEERARHKKNKVHLHRMNVDCRHMQRTISDLHKEIADAMKLKFGMKVNIDDLEETILRRMVMKLRCDMLDIGSEYVKESKMLSELYTKKQIELKNLIKENTARVELLSVLKKEKTDLARLLALQSQKMQKVDQRGDHYFIDDIEKLSAVAQTQIEQIQSLKSEIKLLSTKSLPSKPIVHEETERIPNMEESNEIVIDDFDSLNEIYIGSELKAISYNETEEEEDVELQITEQDITGCIQDLIKEIVDDAVEKKDSKEDIIIKVISDLIDQIPTKYLENTDSLEFVANLIRDMTADIEIDTSTIVEKVSEITGRKLENIQSITESILNKVFDTTTDQEPET